MDKQNTDGAGQTGGGNHSGGDYSPVDVAVPDTLGQSKPMG